VVDKVLFSHESEEWQTPKSLYNQLNEVYEFVLDPCTTKDNPLRTAHFYTKEDDGLKKSWDYGNVFVNPPYNQKISKWLEKATYEIKHSDNIEYIVFLLPVRTDTKWFHKYLYDISNRDFRNHIKDVCFLKGRLKFTKSKNSAPFPSMVVVFSK
jgi:phage N-6-adenine-methyltransferase